MNLRVDWSGVESSVGPAKGMAREKIGIAAQRIKLKRERFREADFMRTMATISISGSE